MISDVQRKTVSQSTAALVACGTIMSLAFAATALMAPSLDVSDARNAPAASSVYGFVGAMMIAGLAWMAACWLVVRRRNSARTFWIIAGFTMIFRAIVFNAPPILELDLYRYLWDGFVSGQGVSPYAYSPAEVAEAQRFGDLESNPDLRRLAFAADDNATARAILARVHYPSLTTVYPPAAQWVFATSMRTSQRGSIEQCILTMKSVFGISECAMLVLVGVALQHAGLPLTWLVIPAWCPLLIISTWNQAHLDVMPAATCFAAAVMTLFLPPISASLTSGSLLALAGGMKIYPLVLTPLFAAFVARRSPPNRRAVSLCLFTVALLGTSAIVWRPLIDQWRREVGATVAKEPPRNGFKAFASQWEMYDSFFAILEGNLTPSSNDGLQRWYVFVPQQLRQNIGGPQHLARAIWLGTTTLLTLIFAWRVRRRPTPQIFLESSFLLLIWFWALGPVCNPWYLLWSAPFLPFVANPGWQVLYALTPALFLRFGLAAKYGMMGEDSFDQFGVFVFTAAWLLAIVASRRLRYRFDSISTGTITLSDPERNPSRSMLT